MHAKTVAQHGRTKKQMSHLLFPHKNSAMSHAITNPVIAEGPDMLMLHCTASINGKNNISVPICDNQSQEYAPWLQLIIKCSPCSSCCCAWVGGGEVMNLVLFLRFVCFVLCCYHHLISSYLYLQHSYWKHRLLKNNNKKIKTKIHFKN